MSTDLRADEADPATAPEGVAEDDPPSHSARPAFIAFVGAEIAGLVMYLYMGRAMWFYGDEWKVLSSRGLPDMFRQHGGHLIALPFAVYRLQYFLFGLRTYMPYLALVVLLHLAVAALLRVIMRRAGVGPWLATAAACLYVFFGSGSQNTLWAFQITFVGAVAFGLLQLLLADHSGPLDRRDWLGLGCGLLAIACAGVAVTMIAIVGIAATDQRSLARGAVSHGAARPFVGIVDVAICRAAPVRHNSSSCCSTGIASVSAPRFVRLATWHRSDGHWPRC